MVNNQNKQKDIADQIESWIKATKEDAEEIQIEQLASYTSIKFFNLNVLRIKWGKSKQFISISPVFAHVLEDFNFEHDRVKSDPWIRIPIANLNYIQEMQPLFLRLYDESYLLAIAEKFSCCSRYEACSNEKRCVQPDRTLAIGCIYRRNIEDGKIFFGKNKI